jgi:hypothetical protein
MNPRQFKQIQFPDHTPSSQKMDLLPHRFIMLVRKGPQTTLKVLSAEHPGISEKCGGGARSGDPQEGQEPGQGEDIRKAGPVTPTPARLFKSRFPAKSSVQLVRCGRGGHAVDSTLNNPIPKLVVYLLCTRCFGVERQVL